VTPKAATKPAVVVSSDVLEDVTARAGRDAEDRVRDPFGVTRRRIPKMSFEDHHDPSVG